MNGKDWKNILTPAQYQVTRLKGTEAPFSGEYNDFFKNGDYFCVGCASKLFDSQDKFVSGCGWPAFAKGDATNLATIKDTSHGMIREEVTCKNCGAHLGHVFYGESKQHPVRYCINSVALKFQENASSDDDQKM